MWILTGRPCARQWRRRILERPKHDLRRCNADAPRALTHRTTGRGPAQGKPILMTMSAAEPLENQGPASLEILVDNHRTFLKYLERRVEDRALAEDILQDAFMRIVDRPENAPADEGIVPWFYRVLRNSAIDRLRRRGTAARALEAFARELETHESAQPELEAEICGCVTRLAATLKAEYAEALQAIDVGGQTVKAFAAERGLSPGNAGVRVFRAREALKKRVAESCGTCAEHGCRDCSCQISSA